MKREDGGMTFYPRTKERLKFKIVSRGKEIAAFLNESDRNICLDALSEAYGDCNFESKED